MTHEELVMELAAKIVLKAIKRELMGCENCVLAQNCNLENDDSPCLGGDGMIKLDDIPKEMRQERHDACQKCSIRKSYAKRFDVHFDWVDCPYDCENDYEHLERELAKMDGDTE